MIAAHETHLVRHELSKLPDVEKLLAKVCSYSVKQKAVAAYFEDINMKKMQDFRKLLNAL